MPSFSKDQFDAENLKCAFLEKVIFKANTQWRYCGDRIINSVGRWHSDCHFTNDPHAVYLHAGPKIIYIPSPWDFFDSKKSAVQFPSFLATDPSSLLSSTFSKSKN